MYRKSEKVDIATLLERGEAGGGGAAFNVSWGAVAAGGITVDGKPISPPTFGQ